MNERPILFSAPMIRAILEGRKFQTRRLLYVIRKAKDNRIPKSACIDRRCPPPIDYGPDEYVTLSNWYKAKIGDTLWVRETWAKRSDLEDGSAAAKHYLLYRADGKGDPYDPMNFHDYGGKWRPSIFMPRWASRIDLEITGIRVERLNDISEDDAKAEGVKCGIDCPDHRIAFGRLWDSINGDRAPWKSNPWVWAITFKRIDK